VPQDNHRPASGQAQWSAVVLTGGGSRRMGTDKSDLTVGGVALLHRLLREWPPHVPVVISGPDPGPVDRPAVVTVEDPPGGGPVAGIAAAVVAVTTPVTALVAVDQPFAAPLVARLAARMIELQATQDPGAEAAPDALVPVDADGSRQPLCAVYATRALVRRCADLPSHGAGVSVRALIAGLVVRDVPLLDDEAHQALDVDTPADLQRARLMATESAIMTLMSNEQMSTWVAAAQAELGLTEPMDIDLVLDVAKDVAHGVERPAAPVTTYLLGAAVAGGMDPGVAAARLRDLADGWTP
jgi:molybdopterin-guanine dinucleotide biosynthesis protein A